MGTGIEFFIEAAILTEVLTNVVRTWGIFQRPRDFIKRKSNFLRKLLDCFECTSIWVGTFVAIYLIYFEFTIFSYLLIFSGLARYIHVVYEWIDAARAVKENEI